MNAQTCWVVTIILTANEYIPPSGQIPPGTPDPAASPHAPESPCPTGCTLSPGWPGVPQATPHSCNHCKTVRHSHPLWKKCLSGSPVRFRPQMWPSAQRESGADPMLVTWCFWPVNHNKIYYNFVTNANSFWLYIVKAQIVRWNICADIDILYHKMSINSISFL